MNIYLLIGENLYNDDFDCFLNKEYLKHEKKYSKEEFNILCKELKKEGFRDILDLKSELIRRYNFKELDINGSFEI